MNEMLYLFCIVPLIVILLQRNRNNSWVAQYINNKYRKEIRIMIEAVKKFIDIECIVYLFNGQNVRGIIQEVTDHSLMIKTKTGYELINLDFVIRIQEKRKKSAI